MSVSANYRRTVAARIAREREARFVALGYSVVPAGMTPEEAAAESDRINGVAETVARKNAQFSS